MPTQKNTNLPSSGQDVCQDHNVKAVNTSFVYAAWIKYLGTKRSNRNRITN
jgi:hypothetical protein